MDTKTCLACSKPLKGRLDKKFCDDSCRNNYNNLQNSDATNFMRNINNALRKNRRVLEQHLPPDEKMVKVHKEKLLAQGFQFKYHTHQYENKNKQIYYFCYEFGFLPLENDWYLIVKRND